LKSKEKKAKHSGKFEIAKSGSRPKQFKKYKALRGSVKVIANCQKNKNTILSDKQPAKKNKLSCSLKFLGALIKSEQSNGVPNIGKNAGLGIVIQARMGSSRFPGKVAKIVNNKEYLLHQIDRVLTKCPAKQCVVATTNKSEDDVVCDIAVKAGVPFFRGSSGDVLKRYIDAAEYYRFADIVRLTGDCPLIDPYIMDAVIGVYNDVQSESKYVSNTLARTFPRGFDVEITTLRDLKKAWELSDNEYDREHVTPYIKYGIMEGCVRINCSAKIDKSKWRFTLDTIEDHFQLSRILAGVNSYKLDAVMRFSKKSGLLLIDT
jgi:spore coat polysaccharide biosynthesis protein SpsF